MIVCRALFAVLAPVVAVGLRGQAEVAAPVLPDDPFAAVVAMPVHPQPERGVGVQVVTADGKPAAAAIVIVLDAGSADHAAIRAAAEQRFPGDEPAILAARATRGSRCRVDERGIARVPAAGRGRIVAVHGRLVASVIRSDATPVERGVPMVLRLLPPEIVRVSVCRADGVAAPGVAVGIAADAGSMLFPRATCGEDGVVEFRLVPGRSRQAIVQLDLARTRPVTAPLPMGGGDVRMQMPPCGSVKATFAGEILPGSKLTWSLVTESGHRVGPTSVTGKSATFDRVEPGCGGRVFCSFDGGIELHGLSAVDELQQAPIAVADLGEVVAGAVATVTVAFAAEVHSVVLRVLDPTGAPVRSAMVVSTWTASGGWQRSGSSTNAEGWIELVAPERFRAGAALRLQREHDTAAGTQLDLAEITVGQLAAGRTQRGEIRLQPAPIAVAGVVVDAAGKPVAGIRGLVRDAAEDMACDLFRFTTGSEGTFAVAMPAPHPELVRLWLSDDLWFFRETRNDGIEIARGVSLRLEVAPAARLRFKANGLPRGIAHGLSARLEPVGADCAVVCLGDLDLDAEILRVPDGDWNFVVSSGQGEVYRIDRVHAAAGIESHDPRLMEFDWKQFASVVSIRVENQAGEPTDAFKIRYAESKYSHTAPPTQGQWLFLAPKEGGAVTVLPNDPSLSAIELGTVTGERVVRLGS